MLLKQLEMMQTKEGGFLSILLSTLGVNLLQNLSAGKRIIRASERTVRVGQGFHTLTNF